MIGIDVGGANLKLVEGNRVTLRYCPLWEKAPLGEHLRAFRDGHPDPDAAVVMSGEIADCFGSKMEGIRSIVASVREVYPGAIFYGTDAEFHREPVPRLAAANWLASADLLHSRFSRAMLLDIGSTTTDILPLPLFSDLIGLTDLGRLRRGYLLYTGLLRTPVEALISEVTLDGSVTPVSTEHFAIAADAHLVLGHIPPGTYSCDTPDRAGKDVGSALRRLARVVCADLEEIGPAGAMEIARQFWESQRDRIRVAVDRVAVECGAEQVMVAGIGSSLLARELGGVDLARQMGAVSDALPAYAVKEVALRGAGP
ncbi:MAG TPA: hydantoinase/oxoprolinase family protein [Methanomicrobiales archaeon]|nr:hydantoinase/oxoprolinase family protein [Methanomicrobiales archaeon]